MRVYVFSSKETAIEMVKSWGGCWTLLPYAHGWRLISVDNATYYDC